MAPRKKSKAVESGSSSESDMEYDDAEPFNKNEEIQVDFEGRNPIDSDFHGIKQLLAQLLLKAPVNFGDLSMELIKQSFVGSVIQQSLIDDDEDDSDDDDLDSENLVFGITSVLNLSNSKKNLECIQQFNSYIIQRAEINASETIATKFKELLTNKNQPVGFLINERFVNIPCQISVPLFESLTNEISSAVTRKLPFNFSYFLMIIKFYRKEAKNNHPPEDTFSNQEEEIIIKNSIVEFEYSVASEKDSGFSGDWLEDDPSLVPYRKVIIFESSKLSNIINLIKEYIS